jgi:hypothetical protein
VTPGYFVVTLGIEASPVAAVKTVGQALCLDVESCTDAELVSIVCLQGLANRDGARVFLTLQRRQCHSSFENNPLSADGAARLTPDTLARYRSAPEFWRDYYSTAHGHVFEPASDPMMLLDLLGDRVKGVVRFKLGNRCELPVAVTIAGVEDAVAVPDESPWLQAFLDRLPVVADIRDRFASRIEASTWAFRELLPRCARNAVFSQNDTNDQRDPDIFSLDLAVAGRMFVFNLDFWQARAPDHFALIQKILARLEPMSPMYGWGTSEAAMMVAMGPSGTFLICTGCPNLSFHKQIPSAEWPLRARRRFDLSTIKLENRCYVTFMVNEGDTLKWMGSVMGAGRWLESGRGRLPVNWGISPFINECYPGLMEYYYRTSSEQDVFVSSISGYGYYGLKHSAHAGELADREARLLADSDVTVGSVYAVHGMLDATNGVLDPDTEDWLVRRGCRGYVFEAAQQNKLWMTRAGQPVIGTDWSLFYWKYRIPGEGAAQLKAVAERIKELGRANGTPCFVPVYGGSPADFIQIAAHLDPDQFTVVGLDEMVQLAKCAYPLSASTNQSVPSAGPSVVSFLGKHILASRGANCCGDPVVIDLAAYGVGRIKASLRFGWDDTHLHVSVEELSAPISPCESRQQAGYVAGEFDLVDGVGCWFDFDLDGTRERGDFTLWLGFSSSERTDLWCCMLNDRVLANLKPDARVRTSMRLGLRRIEASVAWSDLQTWLDPRHQPAPSLLSNVREGFQFGCQPMLVEGRAGRAFLNGRSNRRQNATAAALEDQRTAAVLPMPNGFDAASVRVALGD